jgi:hypothetical protein
MRCIIQITRRTHVRTSYLWPHTICNIILTDIGLTYPPPILTTAKQSVQSNSIHVERNNTMTKHTPTSCLSTITIEASHLQNCDSLEQEFRVIKKIYHEKILKEHPVSSVRCGTVAGGGWQWYAIVEDTVSDSVQERLICFELRRSWWHAVYSTNNLSKSFYSFIRISIAFVVGHFSQDKGGDPAVFRETRAAFEVLRSLYQEGSVQNGTFASYYGEVDDFPGQCSIVEIKEKFVLIFLTRHCRHLSPIQRYWRTLRNLRHLHLLSILVVLLWGGWNPGAELPSRKGQVRSIQLQGLQGSDW